MIANITFDSYGSDSIVYDAINETFISVLKKLKLCIPWTIESVTVEKYSEPFKKIYFLLIKK